MSLRGDPAFDASSLSSAQQTRLSTMKTLISTGPHARTNRDPYHQAARDDTWWYSHDLLTNIQAQLLVFRATGDLWFLDTLYELGELMRDKLDTKYRGTASGGATEGEDDGFLKWVQDENATTAQQGTDLRRDYDYGAHYCSILITHVLDLNRGLSSPKAHDYGEHADFMLGYHINHYEAKFRSRNSVPTGFPLESQPATQTPRIAALMMWHYYMGLLTGDSAYTDEATRFSNALQTELCATSSPSGLAYVWRRQVKGLDSHSFGDYLSPSTYGEHLISALMDAHFEGFDVWGNDVHLEQFARMMTEFMADTADPVANGFTDCVGGNVDRCGYETWSSSHFRVDSFRYQNGMWGTMAAWDASGAIEGYNTGFRAWAESGNEDYTRLVAAQFLHEHLTP